MQAQSCTQAILFIPKNMNINLPNELLILLPAAATKKPGQKAGFDVVRLSSSISREREHGS
jgi:hypothetical protein